MKELTKDIPKPLLPVNGIPLIYYSLFQIWKQNAEGAVINTHYLGEKIRKELETFSLFPLVFSEEKKKSWEPREELEPDWKKPVGWEKRSGS